MAIIYKERRDDTIPATSALRKQLSEAQRFALVELERFGWELRFIRRPLFQDPVPVVSAPARGHYAVLLPDGEIDHSGRLKIRD